MDMIYRRKNYFVNKGFQGRYIFQFYGLIASGALLFMLFFLLTTSETFMVIYGNHDVLPGSTPFILIKELIMSNWILVVLMGFIAGVISLLLTHRIAGPLHKFEIVLKNMQEGILDPHCKLREKDDAQEVMGELRLTNRFFADKVNELRGIADKLRETIKTDSQSGEALISEVDKLEAIINGFTIKE